MNSILSNNPRNLTAFIIRITLGLILFPHGAQKLLGWFGGYGFSGTMGFFTGTSHMAYITALLVILIEFFGSILLLFGFLTLAVLVVGGGAASEDGALAGSKKRKR